jgi:ribosome-associated toxin RatA of RatAB toxin-antitoxin module
MKIEREAIVPYLPEQMYHLVDDIERYPSFLPWCQQAKVVLRRETLIEASITVHKAGVTKVLTTRNVVDAPHSVSMTLLEGPFKSFDGAWRFVQVGENGCHVMLCLAFEFQQGWVNRAFAKVFSSIANDLVHAFCQRAHTLYGDAHAR